MPIVSGQRLGICRAAAVWLAVAGGAVAWAAPATDAKEPPPARGTFRSTTRPTAPKAVATPTNLEDLRAIERKVEAVVKKATPATVGVSLGAAQGSAVIVSKDGYVLTAGHVAQEPDKDVSLVLADGRRVKGKTLGMNRGIDSGMIKITDPAPDGGWPFAERGTSGDLKPGQWVIAMGHPGGYRKDRPPVVRLGRVLTANNSVIDTDCTLMAGDSGGPLFDLDGKVVGIHSRIGNSTLANMDVPVDTFNGTWDRLAKGEAWGDRFAFGGGPRGPMLGVLGENHDKGLKVTTVTPDGPAAKAGLKPGDIIAQMDGRPVENFDTLARRLGRRKAGDEVSLQVLRGDETLDLKATLAKRPEM